MVPDLNEQPGDLFPADLTRKLIRRWWMVVFLMIVGGLLGLLFSRIQRPVYESTSVITTVINYAYAGRLNDYEEDHLITAIGDVISSTTVTSLVVADASDAGIELEKKAILEGLSKSRQGYRWVLSSRFKDPALARQLNMIWLSNVQKALEELQKTGIEGLDALALQHAVESCFSQAVVLDPSVPFCSAEELQQLRERISNTGAEYESSILSKLLISRISFTVTQEPSLPDSPVIFSSGLTVLAGGFAGLLVSIVLLFFYKQDQVQQESLK